MWWNLCVFFCWFADATWLYASGGCFLFFWHGLVALRGARCVRRETSVAAGVDSGYCSGRGLVGVCFVRGDIGAADLYVRMLAATL